MDEGGSGSRGDEGTITGATAGPTTVKSVRLLDSDPFILHYLPPAISDGGKLNFEYTYVPIVHIMYMYNNNVTTCGS